MNSIIVRKISKKYNLDSKNPLYRNHLRDIIGNLFKKSEKEQFWALKDINFTVQSGQVLGIVGSNGAGKSTLLKILAKVTPPTLGEARIYGRVANLLSLGVGFHPDLTGRENIILNSRMLGFPAKSLREIFESILDFAEIGKLIDTPIKFYSSGMYLRLAFSVATAQGLEPDLLLMDEVLAVGDAKFHKKSLKRIIELSENHQTSMIIVSHNLEMIEKLSNSVMWLDRGRIRLMGKPQKVISAYKKSIKRDV